MKFTQSRDLMRNYELLCSMDRNFDALPEKEQILAGGSTLYFFIAAKACGALQSDAAKALADSYIEMKAGAENIRLARMVFSTWRNQDKEWEAQYQRLNSLGKKAIPATILLFAREETDESQMAGLHLKCLGSPSFIPLARLYASSMIRQREPKEPIFILPLRILGVIEDIPHPKKAGFLLSIIKSGPERHRQAAINGLQKCTPGTGSVRLLLDVARKCGRDGFIFAGVAAILSKMGIKAIRHILDCSEGMGLKAEAAISFGDPISKMGPSAVPMLVKEFKRRKPPARAIIVNALGDIGDSRAFDILITALCDISLAVKTEAIAALGKLGDERAIQYILPLAHTGIARMDKQANDALLSLRHLPAWHEYFRVLLDLHLPRDEETCILIKILNVGMKEEAISFFQALMRHEPAQRNACLKTISSLRSSSTREEMEGHATAPAASDFDSLGLKRFPAKACPRPASAQKTIVPASKVALI